MRSSAEKSERHPAESRAAAASAPLQRRGKPDLEEGPAQPMMQRVAAPEELAQPMMQRVAAPEELAQPMMQRVAAPEELAQPMMQRVAAPEELAQPMMQRVAAPEELAQPMMQRAAEPAAPNRTGMPDSLKHGVESLSGHDLSDVRVHYNSQAPAQMQALAYAQGNDIHVGPGQEQHLPHEAWHVVQQREGRVQATTQLMKGTPINDDPALEAEATTMGNKASSHTM